MRFALLPLLAFASACGTGLTEVEVTQRPGQIQDEPQQATAACPGPGKSNRVLVDASRDGGVWWFPQAGPFDPNQHHQGRGLADYLRTKGYDVVELPRGARITQALLSEYGRVIRAGQFGSYSAEELTAYDWFLSCGTTLVLLGEFLRDGRRDGLAESLGVPFTGAVEGNVSLFAEHAVTRNMMPFPYIMGSKIEGGPAGLEVLGRLASGEAVMGIVRHEAAKIFFLGDTNAIELVPQPLVDNLLSWGFPRAQP